MTKQLGILTWQDASGTKKRVELKELPMVMEFPVNPAERLKNPDRKTVQIEVFSDVYESLWIKAGTPEYPFLVGGLPVRSCMLIEGAQFQIGEGTLVFHRVKKDVPVPVKTGRESSWKTFSENGKSLLFDVSRAAGTKLSVYLNGETGTGKELLAELVHLWSPRASGPFIPVNCGALPAGLAESELFGHVKGAFTGAIKDRPGALLQAQGGTLFLDEIADLSLDLQVKLLRFLESGEIKPVGSDRILRADVRVVCASHKPLKQLVREGKFRQDLYFRLASIPLLIPSLRDRPHDIQGLAQEFAHKFDRTLSPRAVTHLKAYPWPGNVRELRHAIERACGLAGDYEHVLSDQHFSFLSETTFDDSDHQSAVYSGSLRWEAVERWTLLRALKTAGGNRTEAAKIMGVARSTLFEMMKRHELTRLNRALTWTMPEPEVRQKAA